VPYVLTLHGGDVPGGNPERTDALFRYLKPLTVPVWRGAASRIAVGEHLRRLGEAAYGEPVAYIPNGVDLRIFTPSIRKTEESLRLLFVGRFSSEKSLGFLVDCLGTLKDLSWNAVFLGDGPERKAVEARIRANGLEERISLPGWVGQPVVAQTMERSDVLLLPSLFEGFSVAAVQGLAAGLALVVSDVPGMSEIVEDGVNGFLCEVRNEAAFSRALRRLTDPDRLHAMQHESVERARRFDLTRVVNRYEEILQTAGAGTAGAPPLPAPEERKNAAPPPGPAGRD
jgi:glycosyltransferase involved in cell wall biosynthesis